ERQSGNNLAVTLNHAQRLLEPWRPPGEPGYLLRLDRHAVRLVTGEHLQVDVDVFDRHLADAARAEDDGVPSTALTDYLAALDLYRGDLGADVPDAPWLVQDRERHRSRFVVAATRAGQLLLGRGDPTAAEEVARRVIDVDPQAEPAHALLVGVALATGDRPAARRRLDRCLALLADLGVAPSEATRRLVNRLRAEPAQPGA
ncbi:MAG TPA: bacterial transcriptional activator domain-containing protein, partial [Acidimicrobiales bacterium]